MAAPQNFVSVSRRPPDVEDYIDILRRYRSWVIGPGFAGLVISVCVAFYMPNVYVASASMQIRPSSISSDVVPSVNAGHLLQRLDQVQTTILGRDNLIAMMKSPKLNLYPKERARYPDEDVEELYFRKKVHIIPMGEGSRGAQAFKITFEYPDKVKARDVVVELVTAFTAMNLQMQSAAATTQISFLDDEVKTMKEKYVAAQNDMAAFSSQNQGKLPANFQGNQMEVQARSAQLTNLNDQITQEKQRQALLDSSLSNNRGNQAAIAANLTTNQVVGNQTVKNQNLINLEQLIANKTSECTALLNHYQPQYPSVVTCNEQKAGLQKQRDDVEKSEGAVTGGGTTTVSRVNPEAQKELDKLKIEEQTILAQLHASVLEQQNREHQAVEVQKLLKEAQDKVAASPIIVQQFAEKQQTLDMAREEYERMTKNRDVSQMGQSMEEHQAGERLDVLEQALLPETPTSPFRSAIVGVGTFLGLAVGFGLAGAKEIKNTSLKNLKDVRAYTNLPVLSSIPLLENALLVRRKRRLAWLAWSTALVVGGFAMCAAVYYQLVIASAQVG
jgi:uncharacterized protein involved in exopolysaccharide biosynthesis